MKMHIQYNLRHINNAVFDVKEIIKKTNKNILAFEGPIGVGKTTFIKKLVHSYGFDEMDVTSPTFNYINIYQTKKKRIYHFDLYRLISLEDFLQLGFQEYLDDQDALIIIEWPEIIEDLLKGRSLFLRFQYIDEQEREIIIEDH